MRAEAGTGRRAIEPGATPPTTRAELADQMERVCAKSFPEPWPAHVFLEELARPESRIELEWMADRLAAYALGWRALGEIQVLHVAVDPAHRGRGVARTLMVRWLERLTCEGVRSLTLEVRESNVAARRLYAGLGLDEQGTRARYYRNGESAILIGGRLPAPGGRLPAPGGRLPAPGGRLPALGGRLPVFGGRA